MAEEKSGGSAEGEDSAAERIRGEAERSVSRLSEGRALPVADGALTVRSVAAVGIFVAVFLVVYLILWALLGGLGLAFGWIPALAAAAVAVKLYAERATGAS